MDWKRAIILLLILSAVSFLNRWVEAVWPESPGIWGILAAICIVSIVVIALWGRWKIIVQKFGLAKLWDYEIVRFAVVIFLAPGAIFLFTLFLTLVIYFWAYLFCLFDQECAYMYMDEIFSRFETR